jgi:hypothetical protein
MTTDLFGEPVSDALFELTPKLTKKLAHRAPVHSTVTAVPLGEGVIRLDLPRWDTAWKVRTRRGGWPRIDPVTNKVLKHRPVWDALRGNARNAHYAQRLNATREVIAAVIDAATHAGLRPCNYLTVQLVWAPGDGRRADEDNLVALQKVCCDALARGRSDIPGLQLVPDDTSKWMRKEMPRIDRPPVPQGLWLEIQVT